MVICENISVFTVDNTAARALRYILTELAVGGNGFRFDCDYGVFILCDDFLYGKFAARGLRQIVVRRGNRFVDACAAEVADG